MKTSVMPQMFPLLLALLVCLPALAPSRAQAQAGALEGGGFFVTRIGSLKVTALSDAIGQMGFALLRDVGPSEVAQAASQAGLPDGASSFPSFVNAFAVELPAGLVLVDTGNGPQANLAASLKAAGIDPSEVKAVLLTHFHGDHIGGLLDAQGQAAFPEATVYADSEEDRYWLGGPKPLSAQAVEAIAPYRAAGRYRLFSPGDEVLPGVEAVELYGHTPGHVGFMFSGGGQDLLAWGDIVHVRLVQFAHPGATLTYDVDGPRAAATRKRIFGQAAGKGFFVAGAHLPFPGLGQVAGDGEAFEYRPVGE
ncbi:MAG: MBL fold metallo-hydrolase [Deltaproteobacteria bacterium]|jgi:glyoxylase-like metal-dependent hydrolase (beta-lactamase superfamily II)|nr:MBL fold metallo-hydrolase [Deltaproteobacteria bacterium]